MTKPEPPRETPEQECPECGEAHTHGGTCRTTPAICGEVLATLREKLSTAEEERQGAIKLAQSREMAPITCPGCKQPIRADQHKHLDQKGRKVWHPKCWHDAPVPTPEPRPATCPACFADSNLGAESMCIPSEGACPIVDAGFHGKAWPTQQEFDAKAGTLETPACNCGSHPLAPQYHRPECPKASAIQRAAPTPEPPYDPEGVNSMVRGMLAGTPAPRYLNSDGSDAGPGWVNYKSPEKIAREAGTPETASESISVHDGTKVTPGETPSALSAAPELEDLDIDGEELVRMRHECCDPEHEKLQELNQILAQNASDASNESGKFALEVATLREKLSTAERERDAYIDAILVGETIQPDGSLRVTLKDIVKRAEAAEAELARVREALQKLRPIGECECDHSDENCCNVVGEICVACIVDAALRTGGEPKV